MEKILNSFYAAEEHRRKVRQAEAEKFRKANQQLQASFYRHTPVPTNNFKNLSSEDIIDVMLANSALHDITYSGVMTESGFDSTPSSYSSCDTSSNDNSSGSDSSCGSSSD